MARFRKHSRREYCDIVIIETEGPADAFGPTAFCILHVFEV
jgi:hypothetical protein